MNNTFSHQQISQLRSQTRGCESRIHFNNAGASLMPVIVADYLRDYLHDEEICGGYETVERRIAELNGFYTNCAKLLNCAPAEVAFVENATRAFDMAFYSFRFKPGDRILTAVAEYGSNVIAYLHQAKHTGVKIDFVPSDSSGQLDVTALEAMIDDRVKLISVTHIPTGGGLVNPAVAIGQVANSHGIPYLLDACQSVGQRPLDVKEIGCDILSGTGRKYLRGPRGTGFLYVRQSLIDKLDPPFLDQHAADLVAADRYVMAEDARRFENWEQYFAGKAGLGVAMNYAMDLGLERIQNRVDMLADELRLRLQAMPAMTITDEGNDRCGIVTFTSDHESADAIKTRLATHGINVSVSDGSGNRVSYDRRNITAAVRASVHYFNTETEIDRFCDLLIS